MVTTTFTVSSVGALDASINNINAQGIDAASNTSYTINIAGPISVAGTELNAINLLSGSS